MQDRLEAQDVASFEDALNGVEQALAEKGMNGLNTEPEVFIVMRNTKPGTDGYRNVEVITYIGADLTEIVNDLTTRQ